MNEALEFRQAIDTMSEVQRLRRALEHALLQDFLDDLPRPSSVSDLAVRLRTSRSLVLACLRSGVLHGRRSDDAWEIDVDDNRDWIASHRRSLRDFRGSLDPFRGTAPIVDVQIADGEALRRLQLLQALGFTAEEGVTFALRSLDHDAIDAELHEFDEADPGDGFQAAAD